VVDEEEEGELVLEVDGVDGAVLVVDIGTNRGVVLRVVAATVEGLEVVVAMVGGSVWGTGNG